MSLPQLLSDLQRYLEHEIDEGRRTVDVTPATAALLRQSLPRAARRVAAAPPARRAGPPAAPTPAVEVAAAEPDSGHEKRAARLQELEARVAACSACSLRAGRTRSVPGQGALDPEVMFVGEAPGFEEDQAGLAFVGPAGQLLTRMIRAMGFEREQVFIANIAKCRPPENRQPADDEMASCLPYLKEQIALIRPRAIVVLGAVALKGLLGVTGITRARGKWLAYEGIPVMPTWHPSYLLRTPAAKRDAWADLQDVLRRLGRPVPEPRPRRADDDA